MSSTFISVWPCCTPGPWSTNTSASHGGHLRRQKANDQLQKTAGSHSRLAQHGPGGCRHSSAVFAAEMWDCQCSRSGATVHPEYATTTMLTKQDHPWSPHSYPVSKYQLVVKKLVPYVLWFVCVSFYVSLGSWVLCLTVCGTSVTNLNEPPRALAASTIAWVRSQLHPFWAVVNKGNAG